MGLSLLQNAVVRTPDHVTLNLFYNITKFAPTFKEKKASRLLKPGVSKSFFFFRNGPGSKYFSLREPRRGSKIKDICYSKRIRQEYLHRS